MVYNQYMGSPTGLTYLAGDIMPWDDYIIVRSDEETSVAVYGKADDYNHWDQATVRTLQRYTSGSRYYYTDEIVVSDVTVNIDEPYYAYGNLIGVPYSLPASDAVSTFAVCGAVVIAGLIAVFRSVYSLKRILRR